MIRHFCSQLSSGARAICRTIKVYRAGPHKTNPCMSFSLRADTHCRGSARMSAKARRIAQERLQRSQALIYRRTVRMRCRASFSSILKRRVGCRFYAASIGSCFGGGSRNRLFLGRSANMWHSETSFRFRYSPVPSPHFDLGVHPVFSAFWGIC